MKNIIFGLLIFIFCSCTNAFAGMYGNGWKAGAAKVSITPEKFIWMAGYGNRDHPAEGKLHELWVKALVIEDTNGKQAVLITLDICSFPKEMSERLRAQLFQQRNLSIEQIIINCSHTHSGPVVMNSLLNIYPLDSIQLSLVKNYTGILEKKIIQAVDMAFRSMRPVQISSGNGLAKFQVNRRNNNESSLLVQSELKGPNDFAVPVISVVNDLGEMMAIVFGYACHNTVLNGYDWSGDYAGFAQIELEKLHPGAVALFFQGAGADLNPLPRRTVPLAIQYGRELAHAVNKALGEEMSLLAPHFSAAYGEVMLALNDPPDRTELLRISEDNTVPYSRKGAVHLVEQMDNKESIPTTYPYPVQVWKLGDQPVFALGGEVVVEYAIELKKLFGSNSFVMGYCNDIMAYIPSSTILRESNYHGKSNVFYNPADAQKISYEGGLDAQMEYGLPSTWRSDIESNILAEVSRLAEKAGVSLKIYK